LPRIFTLTVTMYFFRTIVILLSCIMPLCICAQNTSRVWLSADIKKGEYIQIYSPYHIDEPGYLFSFRGSQAVTTETNKPLLLFVANRFQTPVYFEPGDSITLTLVNKEVIARATNPRRTDDLSFLRALVKKFGTINAVPIAQQNILTAERYDSLLFHAMQKRRDYIKTYRNAEPVSDNLARYLDNHFLYQYLNLTLTNAHNTQSNMLPQRAQSLLQDKAIRSNDQALDADTYQFYLFSYSVYTSLYQNKERSPLDFAVQELTPASKNFLLYTIWQKKQSDIRILPEISLDSITAFVKKHCTDQSMLAEIEAVNHTGIASSGTDGLLRLDDFSTSSFQDVLIQHRGKLILIDCWASWCAPCLDEMPASRKLQKDFQGKAITFLYFSLDKNSTHWRRAAANFPGLMTPNNSFLLLQNYNSSFAKSYGINTLPRYILLDGQGKLLLKNAPRPSDPALKKLLQQYLK
jgi:thiol-disulfide isomerase/thioredoxin